MAYWQIAAGDSGRDYSADFLRYGMAFVGGDNQINTMKKVQAGDIMVLKRGVQKIVAVGKVVARNGEVSGEAPRYGNRDWLYHFDGWELPAWCYVNWHIPETPVAAAGLTRGTILGINSEGLQSTVNGLLEQISVKEAYDQQPEQTKKISDDDLLSTLIGWGLRVQAADEVANTLRRVRLLSTYYMQTIWDDTNNVSEHEARTFLVIPFLIALGWSEQQIKIELSCKAGRIDVACFNRAYHPDSSDCILLIETKRPTEGLDFVAEQAHAYAENLPKCKVAVVTNGYSYKAYKRTENSFLKNPCACLDLRDLRDKYPRDPNIEGVGILRYLLPSYI